MLKATKSFTYASISVAAGEEIEPYVFEADQVATLKALGLVVEVKAAESKKPAQPKPAPKAVKK